MASRAVERQIPTELKITMELIKENNITSTATLSPVDKATLTESPGVPVTWIAKSGIYVRAPKLLECHQLILIFLLFPLRVPWTASLFVVEVVMNICSLCCAQVS